MINPQHSLTMMGVRLEDWERALAFLPDHLRHKVYVRVIASAQQRNKSLWRVEQENRRQQRYGYQPKVTP